MFHRRYYGVGRYFNRSYGGFHHNRYFDNFGWWHFFLMFALLTLVVLLVVFLVKKTRTRGSHSLEENHLKNLLDERFIKGELTEEEYQNKLKVLGLK